MANIKENAFKNIVRPVSQRTQSNNIIYLHTVGHHPLTGGEGYQWAWVRCADAEIGASLVKAFKRAARICGAHDNAPFNNSPDAGTIRIYAFSRTAPRKSGPFGAANATTYAIKISSGALKARSQGKHKELRQLRRMFICKTCQIR